jgi:hypothetical protein
MVRHRPPRQPRLPRRHNKIQSSVFRYRERQKIPSNPIRSSNSPTDQLDGTGELAWCATPPSSTRSPAQMSRVAKFQFADEPRALARHRWERLGCFAAGTLPWSSIRQAAAECLMVSAAYPGTSGSLRPALFSYLLGKLHADVAGPWLRRLPGRKVPRLAL